jgi:glycosyltransferase involved in cell wall biosynthesis
VKDFTGIQRMKITVILCTFNRCQSLAKALESAAALKLPDSVDWEILVVDNNSSDKTREVVDESRRLCPERFRYVFEPEPGKSYALNAGIREARGDVLAFMDDDVTVEPTWLENLTAPLGNGEWAGTGGPILPEGKFVPPPWLSLEGQYALAPLAMFDFGPDACELTESPFGTNMAFHKRMFEKYGGFRTDLGPRPGTEIRSEDTEFGRRLLAAGERFHYEPSAIVYHSVSQNRLNKKYFLTWWFDRARAGTRAFGVEAGTRWYVGRVPLYLFRRLAVWTLRWMLAVNPRSRFSCRLKVWGVAGSILECHSQPRNT